jgi:hypothetical protein
MKYFCLKKKTVTLGEAARSGDSSVSSEVPRLDNI